MSDESERVIAAVGPVVQGPERIYAMLTSSDIPFPTVTLSTGEEVSPRPGGVCESTGSLRIARTASWSLIVSGIPGRPTRQRSAKRWTPTSRPMSSAPRRVDTRARLEAALSGPNVPVAVYDKLVESAHKHLPSLHRYFRLRQRMLGLDDLHYYDIYPSLVASDRKFDIEESKRLTLAASAPLRPALCRAAGAGVRRELDARLSPAGQGVWGLHVRHRVRRPPVSAAQSQRGFSETCPHLPMSGGTRSIRCSPRRTILGRRPRYADLHGRARVDLQ